MRDRETRSKAVSSDSFHLTINGKRIEIRDIDPCANLLAYLRYSGLTGSKEGCAEGDCGACSVVLVEGDSQGGPVYRAINSCITPIVSLAGRKILTVEGIGSSSKMHPVQQEMVRHYGSQCGYCTPGFIASMFEAFHRKGMEEPGKIAGQLCGNLCRCTGYRPIRDAMVCALRQRSAEGEELSQTMPMPSSMAFATRGKTFLRPGSLKNLLECLATLSGARLIAGATEIAVEVNKHFKEFPLLISTEAIPELNLISRTDTAWEIGAGCSFTKIEESLAGAIPLMDEMLRLFASRQIRNRATMGGNVATASPIGDSAPVLLALDATVLLASAGGERRVPIENFFTGYRKTVMRQDEVIRAFSIPLGGTAGRAAFLKVSKRREMDISCVSGCFRILTDDSGKVTLARIAFGGMAATPLRVYAAENAAFGRTLTESFDDVWRILGEELKPLSDVRGSAEYRSAVAGSLWEKFVADEADRGADCIPNAPEEPDRALRHESAVLHVTGEARYVEDRALQRPMLETWLVLSPHARARILSVNTSAAEGLPGVSAVLQARDIPGMNNLGHTAHDEPALADGEVFYHGQPVALVVGESKALCRKAAALVKVEYEPLEAILGIEVAMAAGSYHTEPHRLIRGNIEQALAEAPRRLSGVFEIGGQEHFYLETHAAWAECTDDGSVFVSSSTQHPSEIQAIVAELLGLRRSEVVVEVPRMGGGFGGKETQGNQWAALAALAAKKTGKPVRMQLDRDVDMIVSGKRHPFRADYDVSYDEEGALRAAKVTLVSNGGWALDLSMPVNDRALFHLDNAYYIPAVDFTGQVAKTNLTSQTAFRGFGGPQGMLVIEEILGRIAQELQLPPEEVRRRNFYRGSGETNTTHYGADVENNRLERIWSELLVSSNYHQRREEIRQWNERHLLASRGLAITPVKFGISFTLKTMNQAGALVLLYQDGSAQVNHGGTEMGQGLHTKILGIAMRELGLPGERIRVMHTRTDKVPNTSPTAASCGSDLNGAAVADACQKLIARLVPIAAKLLGRMTGSPVPEDEVAWVDGCAIWKTDKLIRIPFEAVTHEAYMERVSMAATGYYKTPLIYWDWKNAKGRPFHYYAFGAAVSEVEVDVATGMTQVLRVDILHDVGDSLNPGVDRGQVEGGFVQGMGWLTSEELLWNEEGRLLTHSASTYQIPSFSGAPRDFRVQFLSDAAQPRTIGNSKAVGEPPLMLAISVREAIRDAIASKLGTRAQIDLRTPATPEAVYRALHPGKFAGK